MERTLLTFKYPGTMIFYQKYPYPKNPETDLSGNKPNHLTPNSTTPQMIMKSSPEIEYTSPIASQKIKENKRGETETILERIYLKKK